jgi:hypothetical protein
MKKRAVTLLAMVMLSAYGCATQTKNNPVSECCNAQQPEIVYVDRAVAECTRSVQRVTQTSPCASCERFPVSARVEGGCSK